MSYEYDPQIYAEAAIEYDIRTEISSGIEQAGSVRGYINNFTENLDGGRHRSQIEQLGWTDRIMTDSRYPAGSEDSPHSTLAYTRTWGQFFADVDQAVAESGLDQAELARLQVLADQPSFEQREAQEAHSRFTLPVYRQLRILGYSSFDLRR
ncbi:MAG TPA: hypothetical protein VLG16_05155 [Candidatus Saccharimonadales bacterium]|nr:hypothetical protein [Candidatus Saccharimonadales bacterium]